MSLSCSLQPSHGFHFEFSTDLSSIPTKPECVLFLLHVFPPDVLVDKYELTERGLVFNVHGESNLELPRAAVESAGLILEVRVPPSRRVNIPLHARYPHPSAISRHSIVRIAEPQAFWACPSPSKFGTNPFSHLPSPYVSSLDLNEWSITFCDTYNDKRYHEIQVPAGKQSDVIFVEFGTVFVVVAAFFYILRAVWKTTIRMRRLQNLKRE